MKRPVQSASHVSAGIRVVPKKPRHELLSTHPSISLSKSFVSTWENICSSLNSALRSLRFNSLKVITEALSVNQPEKSIPTVCVTLGAAAAAGDRSEIFNAIINHVEQVVTSATFLRLQAAHHASMAAITQLWETVTHLDHLIIAVDDADLFPEAVLRDLVYLAGKRNEKLRVSMLLGFGKGIDTLHAALGVQEATMIALTAVRMPSATACFVELVEKVFSEGDWPMILSEGVYHMLEREFFERESTVTMVLRSMKALLAAHFFRYRIAVALFKWEKKAKKGVRLDAECLGFLKDELKSVGMYIAKKGGESGQKSFREKVRQWLDDLNKWRQKRVLVERVVYKILVHLGVEELPWMRERSSSTDLRLHVFRAFLVMNVRDGAHGVNTERIQKLIVDKVQRLSSKQHLTKLVEVFKGAVEHGEVAHDEDLIDIVGRLDDLRVNLEDLVRENAPEVNRQADKEKGRPKRNAKGGYAARARRRQALVSSAADMEKRSVLKKPREKLLYIFKDLLDIRPLSELPIHELFFLCNTSDLKRLSGGLGGAAEPRGSFFTAMRQPHRISKEITDGVLPDTAIAYRLLAEGGRMKNIYDWYNGFSTVKTANAAQRDDEGKITVFDEIPQAELQARFARACSELEFLGLMKYTNRKTDHVLRLTYE
eukprot:GFKZ01015187.1.p1 GENE.GFKZ01015187.1~~GFKZ01015187.1.p1  ORF type:complete len:656 (+),score=111.69 GFKZ01015187.1:115-2082(+)